MDPHFPEYLAAIAALGELYGDRPDDRPTEFHDEPTAVAVAEPVAAG